MKKYTVLAWFVRDPNGQTEVYGSVETGQKAVVTQVQSILKSLHPVEILITDAEQDPSRLKMIESGQNIEEYEGGSPE